MFSPVTGASTILTRLDDIVQRQPTAIAVIDEQSQWSYRRLWDDATQLAGWLKRRGVGSEESVGICMDRSAEAIAAMLGVMLAGAAFVPLDPDYPQQRLGWMTEDAAIRTILCQRRTAPLFAPFADRVTAVVRQSWEAPRCNPAELDALDWASIPPTRLAYLMYTSGSTGLPKGVQIEHRSLLTYCEADIEVYCLQPSDRTLQFSTLCFDVAIEEIFPPLLVGSTVVVRPVGREEAENELSSMVRRYEITALHLATAYWHAWVDLMDATLDRVPASLRMVLATGEKVSPSHYRKWIALCDHEVLWCNAYGPTEATVTSTVFIPARDWEGTNMPIGKPLPGYEGWILDSHDQPLGAGQTGDLYISGPGVARGYLNRPERTAANFRTLDMPGRPALRMYRTGDLARWLPDGNIECGGRIDHQLKIGTYRIEPAEIEYQLALHEDVREALVMAAEIRGRTILVAYVLTSAANLTPSDLDRFLRERLPAYMIPGRYALCPSFPTTINGKIDRTALPPPDQCRSPENDCYQAPRTPLQKELVHLWEEVLGVEPIGIEDDFFALGGSSLLATRVITRLREFTGQTIPVRDFFANPTIVSIAHQIDAARSSQDVSELRGEQEKISARLRRSLPRIEPFYIPSGDESLFAIHYPACRKTDGAGRWGAVLCGGEGHEYARAHRNLQQLAIRLAQAGLDVLRFDYSGTGNSSGNPAEVETGDWIRDARAACEALASRGSLEKIAIIGIRLGGTIAAWCDSPRIHRRILWDPVVDGNRYLALLESFHQRALRGGWYYQRRRSSRIDQLFGIPCSVAKRESRTRLRLPVPAEDLRDAWWVVTSRGYLQREPALAAFPLCQTEDEIAWHDPRFTESAFSSPQAIGAIVQKLTCDEPTEIFANDG